MAFEGIKKTVKGLAVRLQDWRNTDLNSFILFKTLLFYIGLWPRQNDRYGFGAFYRKWLPRGIFVMINYGMSIGFPVITYQCLAAGEVQAFLESVATIFAAVLMYTHLYCLMFQKDKLRELFKEMDVIREMGKRLPYRPVAILLLNMRWMEFVVFAMVMCGLITGGTGMVLFPKLYLSRNFGFKEWYPFDIIKSPAYEVLFVVNCLRLTFLLIMMILLYMIIWSMFMETVGQYRILSYNIDKVRRSSRKRRAGSPNRLAARITKSQINCLAICVNLGLICYKYGHIGSEIDTLGGVVDDELRFVHGDGPRKPRKKPKRRMTDQEALKRCIQHHQSIIRFVHLVESTFEPILIMHIICTLVPTGLGIALALNAAAMEEKVIMIFFLILGCYLLLAVICLICDEITDQDEGIRDTIFGCDWLSAPKGFTRSMGIVISYCNQPLIIMLAGFIPLNRENFLSTMKLTYSYTMTMLTQFK